MSGKVKSKLAKIKANAKALVKKNKVNAKALIKQLKEKPINVIKEAIIEIPTSVNCTFSENKLSLKKDKLENVITINPVYLDCKYDTQSKKFILKSNTYKRKSVSVLNATKKLISNGLSGLDKEYTSKLAIVFSHFPITIKTEGDKVLISNFLGEKKPRVNRIMPGCTVTVKGKEIVVSGHNKYNVGQTAGNIEKSTKVYKKDFRTFDDGCYIIEKC
ncbi:MAG: 50S ribosomal protein L6 [archaeon]